MNASPIGVAAIGLLLACQTAAPWTAYVGKQTNPAPWARTVRGPSQLARLPFDSVVTAVGALPPGNLAIVNVGGFGGGDSAAMAGHFSQLDRDGGRAWRDTVAARAERLVVAAGDDARIVWQLANEINNREVGRFARGRAAIDGPPLPNDLAIIPMYVEEYLVPSVAALRDWAFRRSGDSSRVRIALGSLANAANPRSMAWLDSLLAYRVAAPRDPALRGRRVADLVDVVTIHYLLTAAGPDWQRQLDGLWRRWVGQGRVRAIWATEELGIDRANQGLGAATAVRVTARWLYWVCTQGLTPEQVRWSLWGSGGGPAGSQGQDGMALLFRVLGDRAVDVTSLPSEGPDEERYVLSAVGAPARVVVAFGSRLRGRVVVRSVDIPGTRPRMVTAYVLDAGEIREVRGDVSRTATGTRLVLERPLALDLQAVLLVAVDAQP